MSHLKSENVWAEASTKLVDILIEIMIATDAKNVGEILIKIENLKSQGKN